jgi:hypothetical protein
MESYPPAERVLDELGDKVIDGLARAVAQAKQDLASYRAWRPDIVADHSERGLANWLHDRVWRHVTAEFDGDPLVPPLTGPTAPSIEVGRDTAADDDRGGGGG